MKDNVWNYVHMVKKEGGKRKMAVNQTSISVYKEGMDQWLLPVLVRFTAIFPFPPSFLTMCSSEGSIYTWLFGRISDCLHAKGHMAQFISVMDLCLGL